MASWRVALAIALAWPPGAGCAHSVGQDFELGDGGGGTRHVSDGAGGAEAASTSADGPATTSVAAGPSTSTSVGAATVAASTGPSTSAQATSVASSSSGSATGCDGSGNCDTCAACAENGACAAELSVCLNDPSCTALAQCLQPCTSQACADQCFQQYQAGLPAYDQLYGCVICGECPSDCDGPSSGCL